MSSTMTYDVVVVGGGHAGCEAAAAAAANLGSSVLLVTMNMGVIGQMSCNPAMGGVAKGQIVREVDALGGYSGIVSDRSTVQFRMLNRSKGPAMWSPRSQNDRNLFASEWRRMLEQTPNVHFWQDSVNRIEVEGGQVVGVMTGMGMRIACRAVVLTSGTFMNGIMHIGERQLGGGRAGEKASHGITEQLVELGFEAGRMKTGTPPVWMAEASTTACWKNSPAIPIRSASATCQAPPPSADPVHVPS
jgi:tRNA uridine 5-carboxymethylaminomethyl modification enzyme